MRQKFNPKDWLSSDFRRDVACNISTVVSRIEAMQIDITGTYADWRNLGFALADELGEGGRDYFHRISRFYSKYAYPDCDHQFDQCLKSQGHGITIKTLFHLGRQAGVEIGGNERGREGENERGRRGENERGRRGENEMGGVSAIPQVPSSEPTVELPTLPDLIFATLPDFLQRVVEVADSNEERDILLLGALGVLSACFPKVWGVYDDKKVFSNLYLYITAQASAGKGRLTFCKQLVEPIHWELRQESERLKQVFDMEMREYNAVKLKDANAEKPEKPPEKMLFIPANSSATGVFQLLADNEDRGLIFETEGDTLAMAFKSDHGNYSDGFRKGAHHERISYYRRTDREYREIKFPCISTVLTSTPKQVLTLIPNAENGLQSRFAFYHMNIRPIWKDVFARPNTELEAHFDQLGRDFFSLYKALREKPAMQFCMTGEQQGQFHVFFTQLQEKYLTLQGMGFMATIRRMGLIVFRISMIFTALRIMETGDFSPTQVCTDTDFQASLSMARVLVQHSSHVFSELPEEVKPAKAANKMEMFMEKLPAKFTRKEYLTIAKSLTINERTADRYMVIFCEKELILKEEYGNYSNLTLS